MAMPTWIPRTRHGRHNDLAVRLESIARRGLPPVELADEFVPFGVERVSDQKAIGGESPDGDAIAGLERAGDLAVDDRGGAFVDRVGDDLDGGLAVDHQRFVGQRVRAERCHDDGIDVGLHDRSAGREVVGRRTAGGADDQSVAAHAGQRFAVHGDPQANDAKRRTGLDDAIVDGQHAVGDAPLTPDVDLQHRPAANQRIIAQCPIELGSKLVHGKLGEETQLPDVDADQWNLVLRERAGDPDQRSIAADDHHAIGGRNLAVAPKFRADHHAPRRRERPQILKHGRGVFLVGVGQEVNAPSGVSHVIAPSVPFPRGHTTAARAARPGGTATGSGSLGFMPARAATGDRSPIKRRTSMLPTLT